MKKVVAFLIGWVVFLVLVVPVLVLGLFAWTGDKCLALLEAIAAYVHGLSDVLEAWQVEDEGPEGQP